MKRKSLLIMLLVAFFVPLAMNAQTKSLKKSARGSKPKLEMRVSKEMPSNPMLTKLESAKEAALEELNDRSTRAASSTVTASRITARTATWTGSGGESWNVNITISNTNGLNQAVNNGYAQFGTQQNYATQGTFSTSGISGTITSIAVDCASYNGNGTVSVTVGGAAFGSSQTIPRWSNNAGGTRTFTGSAEGNIVVTMTNGTSTHRAMYIKSITVTYEDGCSAPTNFAASNVTSNSVTLSWTETGTSEEWAILYMCEEDEEAQVEFTTTNPFTLTGLNPATYYIAEVIPMCGDYDQESDVIEFTTLDLPCPKPTNLNVTAMTPSSATVSWSGEADSYTLQYRPAADNGEAAFSDDFEDAWLDDWDWTTYTQGDAFSGYGWLAYSPDDLLNNSPGAHSGDVCAMSLSYGSAALNANNYLVTPQVDLGGTLKFWIMSNYADEYEVLLSTSGNAIRNFTVTLQAMSAAPSSWTEVSIDLSSYAGQQGYIAIHHVMYDGWVLFLDDFAIYGDAQPAGPWETIENVTSPYTITGLDGETTYEWQVQGNCGSDGLSLWSSIATFTTPSSCGTPTGLTTTDITNNSATLSWTAALDAYNVRYRKGFVYDFESAEPWTYTNFAPCTTYDGDEGSTYYFQTGTFPNQGYVGACIAFQNGFNTNMVSHDGNAFGVMFNQPGPTNDWFILPELEIEAGDVLSFWTREITNQYGNEIINVGVCGSTDGTFSSYLVSNYGVSATDWTELSYDLSSYAGQTIRLAINCVSNDIFGLMIDDIFVGNPSNDWSTPVAVNGSTYALTGLDMETSYTWQVQGVDCDGNGGTTNWASAYFTTLDGILVESITAANINMEVGQTTTITPNITPSNATNQTVTYASNNAAVATVDPSTGLVTAVGPGTATITIAATDGSNVTGTCTVTVTAIAVTGITASDVTVVNGETATISYTVAPDNATDPSVTFTSASDAIATVDANGVVTGHAVGTTTITITSVSNPEVTAEITVTVTSNPNAVQFTVTAPANAQPGDVITVDFMLAAPTTGTYTGFTGLDVNLYFETAAFQYNSKANGAVADAVSDIDMGQVSISGPNTNNPNRVKAILSTPANHPVTAEGIVFSATFTVLQDVALGSYTFNAEINEFDYTTGEIGNSNTVDIPYEFTPSTVTIAALEQYTKHIGAHGTHGYYLIASPIGEVNPGNVTNMLTPKDGTANTYDLYSFNQAEQLEWRNYRQSAFEVLEPGKGYLYANLNDVDLVFTGSAYNGSGVVTLSKTAASDGLDFPDWNLVGNPFAVVAYIGKPYYKMDANGNTFIPVTSGNTVEPMEGIFVVATSNGETMTFSTTPTKKGSNLTLNLSDGGSLIDRAIVIFSESEQLPKLQFDRNSTKVYIPQDGQDYAIVRSEEMGALPVNFKAEKNGTYSLNLSGENVEFAYLHLIDNKTGKDVDLLQTPSYSFEAKTTDYESRFKLVFATGDNSNDDNFAFFSNGSFVINNDGEAELQVIDVMGRILSSETINGCANVSVNAAPGIYMLRLINGDNVKVQKVVVK